MRLQFYLQGGVEPAVYDFDLTCGGALCPSGFDKEHRRDVVMVLLENDGSGITLAQAVTVNCLCGLNPNWDSQFYFENTTSSGEAGQSELSWPS